MPDWVFAAFVLAENIFWLQQWVYVSQYLLVALIVPLTFCIQSDQVKAKRQRYSRVLFATNLMAFTSVAAILTVELVMTVNRWILELVWGCYSIVVTWALCFALRRIRSYMKLMDLGGLLPARVLSGVHQGFFIAGSVFGFIFFALDVA